ncbi:hypothetical protein ACV3W4_15090 [Clostridium perfringens]|uniref:hypothetical protein n=1 Tax=Clostridium perfringens TaxID=1502 RepID=UPI00016BD02D|nr:hypothetical protein [Clostridium perfringens]EDT79839.1 hypothetical protein AC7_2532 [Clostridium perfringens NCTC 8239]NGT33409.1 hypothetical protein [Clostridium perfringens]NGU11134.1 hypothetical protein [Clostridium perfringens]
MNSTERELFVKYGYKKPYIYMVYEEFELRVNNTLEEYDGLRRGECRFDYYSWEKRLGLSHWQMNNAIKTLIKDECIEQRIKGKKGTQSTYFLSRFNLEFDQQKKQQNFQQKEQQNKSSDINRLEGINQQKEQQKNKQETVQSSIHNNLNIISNNIYSSNDIEEIFNYWNSKKIIKHNNLREDIKKAIKKATKSYSIDEIKQAIDTYSEILKSEYYFTYKWNLKDFLNRNNAISTFMEDGSNKANYEEWKNKNKSKEEPKRRGTNLDDL